VSPVAGRHGGGGREEGAPILMAWAELGSAGSRNRPGARHVVRLSSQRTSVIVAGSLSETSANSLAESINDFLTDSFGYAANAAEFMAHRPSGDDDSSVTRASSERNS
jgi:hypothetical protein